jgi:hypothetical protein
MTVSAGAPIYASDINNRTPTFQVATAAQSVISSTSYVASTHLFTPTLLVGLQYEVFVLVNYSAGTTGDIKVKWTTTGVAAGNRAVNGPSSAEVAAEDEAEGKFASSGPGTDVHYGVRSGALDAWFTETMLLRTVTTAGVWTLNFAQFASEAVNTTIQVGSYVRTTLLNP